MTSRAISALDALFQPFQLKSLRLKNRFVMAPMGRNMSRDGVLSAGYGDYFRRRVEGGVALCVGEASGRQRPEPGRMDQEAIGQTHIDGGLAGAGEGQLRRGRSRFDVRLGSRISRFNRLAEMVGRGDLDLVSIGRALITKPGLPKLQRERRFEQLQPYTNMHLATLA